MNKENLGKLKYIYKMYTSDDKVVHCERYPVIYINQNVVYYKDARKSPVLITTDTRYVVDKYTGIKDVKLNYWGQFSTYFWEVESFSSEEATDYAFAKKKMDDIAKAKSSLERAENDYKSAKERYESLTKEAKNV